MNIHERQKIVKECNDFYENLTLKKIDAEKDIVKIKHALALLFLDNKKLKGDLDWCQKIINSLKPNPKKTNKGSKTNNY